MTVTGLLFSVKYGQKQPKVAEKSMVVKLRGREHWVVLGAGYRAEAGGAEQNLQPTGNPHPLCRRRCLYLFSSPTTAKAQGLFESQLENQVP